MSEANLSDVARYYAAALATHGPTARGVDWNSQESQYLRFHQLADLWRFDSSPGSVLDFGCGFGAFLSFLQERRFDVHYVGYDIERTMVEAATQLHGSVPNARFTSSLDGVSPVEYVIASGVLNVKLDHDEQEWHQHVLATVDTLARLSTRGFAFNLLTQYSDVERRRPHLYYADPHALFDYCRTQISRRVALLHDYPLYEFTLHVRH